MSSATDIVKSLRKQKLDVSILSDENSPCIVKGRLSTGCLVLDAIMGGGLPFGRLTTMYGDASSGKSLIAAQIAALAQQDGVLVAYDDTEGTVSIEMMKMLGVNVDDLIYTSSDTIEDVFNFFEHTLAEKNKIAPDKDLLLIWDSIAAASSDTEMENPYGKSNMGRNAQVISQSLRKFSHAIAKENVCALFLNQVRQKIGVMFGDSTATPGGEAVRFYSSVMVKLDLAAKLKAPAKKGKPKIIGMNTTATCVKNKTAFPFRSATLPIYFGHAIDDPKATMLYLIDQEMVTASGAYYTLELNGKQYKFTKKTFVELYDKMYDDIAALVMSIEDADADVDQEKEE